MCELSELFPSEIKTAVVEIGTEWTVPKREALLAIEIATKSLIAVLGIECLETCSNDLRLVSYSRYEFLFADDWPAFVRRNNDEAKRFVNDNPGGDDYAYVLISTSREIYGELSVMNAGPG